MERIVADLALPERIENLNFERARREKVSVKKSGDWFSAPSVPTMVGGRRSLHFWNYQS